MASSLNQPFSESEDSEAPGNEKTGRRITHAR